MVFSLPSFCPFFHNCVHFFIFTIYFPLHTVYSLLAFVSLPILTSTGYDCLVVIAGRKWLPGEYHHTDRARHIAHKIHRQVHICAMLLKNIFFCSYL